MKFISVYVPVATYKRIIKRKGDLGIMTFAEYVRHVIFKDLKNEV